jgi:hypothetical protein
MTKLGFRKHRLAAILATVALGTSLTTVFGAPAQAVSCAGPSNRPNGEGYLLTYASVPLRTGPYGECSTISHIPTDRLFWIHCNWTNIYGNHWYYGRVGGTSTYGWVYRNTDVEYRWQDENDNGAQDVEWCTPPA